MHDAAVVGSLERARQLHRNVEQRRKRHSAVRSQLGQIPAAHQLHRQEVQAVRLLDGMDGDDVGVLE